MYFRRKICETSRDNFKHILTPIFTIYLRCQLLEVQLQRKESEVDVLKQRMAQQQDRFDQSTEEFEQRLDLARDKERQLISVRVYLLFV